jgi:hypothetical protein
MLSSSNYFLFFCLVSTAKEKVKMIPQVSLTQQVSFFVVELTHPNSNIRFVITVIFTAIFLMVYDISVDITNKKHVINATVQLAGKNTILGLVA